MLQISDPASNNYYRRQRRKAFNAQKREYGHRDKRHPGRPWHIHKDCGRPSEVPGTFCVTPKTLGPSETMGDPKESGGPSEPLTHPLKALEDPQRPWETPKEPGGPSEILTHPSTPWKTLRYPGRPPKEDPQRPSV